MITTIIIIKNMPVEKQFKSICWEFHLKYKILLTNASSTRPDIALDSNTCPLDNISAVRVNEQLLLHANISALLNVLHIHVRN